MATPRVKARVTLGIVVFIIAVASRATAQTEAILKSSFEGRRVRLRIDMPGSSDGVDVHPDARRAVDYQQYRDDLKRYGVAIHAGDAVVVTLVKMKKDLVEFQLGGGGFGTFGDDTSTSVYMPLVERSEREKYLEKRVREEDDRGRRRELQRELDDLRDRRERENRRITADKEWAEAQKQERIAQERLHSGSRFNLRYDGAVPSGLRPEDVVAALTEYVDFTNDATREAVSTGAEASPFRKGMLRDQAERLFGRPVGSSSRREGAVTVATLIFESKEDRISADFVDDVLVRYTITSK